VKEKKIKILDRCEAPATFRRLFRPRYRKGNYRSEKSKLLSRKSRWKKKFTRFTQTKIWLEPMQEWIKDAQNMEKIALDTDLFAQKGLCQRNLWLEPPPPKQNNTPRRRRGNPKLFEFFGENGRNSVGVASQRPLLISFKTI
jgi:hypothetical protein